VRGASISSDGSASSQRSPTKVLAQPADRDEGPGAAPRAEAGLRQGDQEVGDVRGRDVIDVLAAALGDVRDERARSRP